MIYKHPAPQFKQLVALATENFKILFSGARHLSDFCGTALT
jgi:hypothetical protein